jgi:hypothetical protein
MIKNKENFLREVALNNDLKDNLLSLVFAFNPDLDISKREKFVDTVFPFYHKYKNGDRNEIANDTIEFNELIKWTGKDLRIKKIKLKNVRGFPNTTIPYGIEFVNDNKEPQSMIILGGNGYGKSSVFGSLEYTFCKKVGEAQLRTDKLLKNDSEEYRNFLEHFNNGFTNANCLVETVSESFTLQGLNIPESVRIKINPQTHFISDCDIYDFCKLNYISGDNNSFHNILAHSLGLKELLDFEKNLKTFIAYSRRTESDRIKVFEKSIKQDEDLIKSNNEIIVKKQEQIRNIRSISDGSQIQTPSKVPALLAKLKIKSFGFEYDYKALTDSIEFFRGAYKRMLAVEDNGITTNRTHFLKLGLDLARSSADCPLCNSSKKPREELLYYLEEKLKEIELHNAANHEATKTFNLVTEKLENLTNTIALFKSSINAEYNEIKEHVEFADLIVSESEILLMLDVQMAHEFFSMISNLKQNPKYVYVANPLEFFDSVFDVASDFIQNNLCEFLKLLTGYSQKREQLLKNIEDHIVSTPSILSNSEQLAVLNNEVSSLVQQNQELQTRIVNNEEEVIRLRLIVSQFNKVKDDARQFVAVYHNKLNKEVQSAFAPIQKIVTEVLNQYLINEGRQSELEISIQTEEMDPETGEVLSEIIVARVIDISNGSNPTSVNKYFNTFHYRLFATMVGISVAIASRTNTRINMPLVLDDIFYASDFENRTSIEGFLENVFKIFKQFTPDMPVQLIMFTHDQLIFESVLQITPQIAAGTIGFAKMFPYKDARPKDDYLNLIYKYPYHLSQSIINNLISSYVA